jgi:hypothetical protein
MKRRRKPVMIELTLGVNPEVHALMVARAAELVAQGAVKPEHALCMAYGETIRMAFDAVLEVEREATAVTVVVAA